jgi:hypothetical protein
MHLNRSSGLLVGVNELASGDVRLMLCLQLNVALHGIWSMLIA